MKYITLIIWLIAGATVLYFGNITRFHYVCVWVPLLAYLIADIWRDK